MYIILQYIILRIHTYTAFIYIYIYAKWNGMSTCTAYTHNVHRYVCTYFQNLARLSVRWRLAWYISSRLSVLKSEACSSMSSFILTLLHHDFAISIQLSQGEPIFSFSAKLIGIILIQQAGLLLMNAAAILNEKRFLWSPQTVVSLDFRADVAAMFVIVNKKWCMFILLAHFKTKDPSLIEVVKYIWTINNPNVYNSLYHFLPSHPFVVIQKNPTKSWGENMASTAPW